MVVDLKSQFHYLNDQDVGLMLNVLISLSIHTDLNECLSNPCLNGGACQDLPAGYNCLCPPGFEGINCQLSMNIFFNIT